MFKFTEDAFVNFFFHSLGANYSLNDTSWELVHSIGHYKVTQLNQQELSY